MRNIFVHGSLSAAMLMSIGTTPWQNIRLQHCLEEGNWRRVYKIESSRTEASALFHAAVAAEMLGDPQAGDLYCAARDTAIQQYGPTHPLSHSHQERLSLYQAQHPDHTCAAAP